MKKDDVGRRVCVAIGEQSPEKALTVAKEVSDQADVIEIRLDCLKKQTVEPFIETLKKPLLFTNRPIWEGGNFNGDEAKRIAMLVEAVDREAAYVDLEYQSPEESLLEVTGHLEKSRTRLILSSHNFKMTPARDELLEIMTGMREKGAHIGKIVTTAHSYLDVLRVLRLQEDAVLIDFPLIAFCMGKPGIISRVSTIELGGYMTYCSVDEMTGTAPGQISVAALREIYRRAGL